jgi:hypothetical protein
MVTIVMTACLYQINNSWNVLKESYSPSQDQQDEQTHDLEHGINPM